MISSSHRVVQVPPMQSHRVSDSASQAAIHSDKVRHANFRSNSFRGPNHV